MVINNLYIFRPIRCPYKAHSKLIVNAYAVLSGSISFQGFQAITRRHAQIVKTSRPIKLLKFSSRYRLDVNKSFYTLSFEQALGICALERFDRHIVYNNALRY